MLGSNLRVEVGDSTNATAEAIGQLQRSEGAHRVSASVSHFVHKYLKLSRDPHGFG